MGNLSKAQQERIDKACKKFQKKMQSTVNGSEIESISLQFGNGPEIVVASKKEKDNEDNKKE